jgi:hypothetical protein
VLGKPDDVEREHVPVSLEDRLELVGQRSVGHNDALGWRKGLPGE